VSQVNVNAEMSPPRERDGPYLRWMDEPKSGPYEKLIADASNTQFGLEHAMRLKEAAILQNPPDAPHRSRS
jgi:hypothetical protein